MKKSYSIAAIVLAAGSSKRMGSVNKLLMEVDGIPMIERSISAFLEADLDSIIVVTGFESDRILSCLSGYKLTFVRNDQFERGMGASLATGVRSLQCRELDGFMVSLGDLPHMNSASARLVLDTFKRLDGEKIVVPYCGRRQGHPIAFPISFADEMKSLSGDVGAKGLIRREQGSVFRLEIDDHGIIQDMDRSLG